VLINNATPASQGVQGCPRAQAALFCLFHGNLKHVLASLVARDGKNKVVAQTGGGVTKLPFWIQSIKPLGVLEVPNFLILKFSQILDGCKVTRPLAISLVPET
jgi:hypothetical protein